MRRSITLGVYEHQKYGETSMSSKVTLSLMHHHWHWQEVHGDILVVLLNKPFDSQSD